MVAHQLKLNPVQACPRAHNVEHFIIQFIRHHVRNPFRIRAGRNDLPKAPEHIVQRTRPEQLERIAVDMHRGNPVLCHLLCGSLNLPFQRTAVPMQITDVPVSYTHLRAHET